MCLAAIFVTISCLFSHQATIAIVNIILVLLMVVGSQRLDGELSQPQYYEQYETINSEWIDENGNIRMTKVSKGSGEIHRAMWQMILKKQLQVTQEYFNSKI